MKRLCNDEPRQEVLFVKKSGHSNHKGILKYRFDQEQEQS
jgi:hypothetical protein